MSVATGPQEAALEYIGSHRQTDPLVEINRAAKVLLRAVQNASGSVADGLREHESRMLTYTIDRDAIIPGFEIGPFLGVVEARLFDRRRTAPAFAAAMGNVNLLTDRDGVDGYSVVQAQHRGIFDPWYGVGDVTRTQISRDELGEVVTTDKTNLTVEEARAVAEYISAVAAVPEGVNVERDL